MAKPIAVPIIVCEEDDEIEEPDKTGGYPGRLDEEAPGDQIVRADDQEDLDDRGAVEGGEDQGRADRLEVGPAEEEGLG